jgi:hypothetical protein
MPARSTARDALCADLLDLLDQIENDITYDADIDDAQRDGAATVINAVCDVIDTHLFTTRPRRQCRRRTTGATR